MAITVHPQELKRHQELGEFLRSRRARLAPEQVGLERGNRRRTPGLRRAEVAALAGVSPEWYTWLEQGRAINVSGQVLERLTQVLRLDTTEREHLFLLAQRQPPPVEMFTPPTISPTMWRFLDQLGHIPAGIVDTRLNVIDGNDAYRIVFGDHRGAPERERNLIWRFFTHSAARCINHEWEALASVYLAQFRVGYARFINDPWWGEQIAALSAASPMFRELWARHEVINMTESRKVMDHPLVGELSFDTLWFQATDGSDLRVLIHTPRSETDTAAKIGRLLEMAHPALGA